jgi:hypothetical protein
MRNRVARTGVMAAIFLIFASDGHEPCLGDGNGVADASTDADAC